MTIGVWLFAGIFFERRIARFEAESLAMGERYVQSQRLLTMARGQVLLSSVYVRDALLDPDRQGAVDAQRRIADTLAAADGSLAEYVPIIDSRGEQAEIAHLREKIADLRDTALSVLDRTTSVGFPTMRVLLREQLMPKRESAMAVADALGNLNRVAFVAHQREAAEVYHSAEIQLWEVLGLSLLASLVIAVGSSGYVRRLERRVWDQNARDEALQDDLRRLSNRLTTAREQERRAVARELHDDIGQLMSALKVELTMAQRALEESGSHVDLLDRARPMADRALQASRDLSHLLHPAVLDDLGVMAASEWFVRTFRERHRLDVVYSAPNIENRLAPDIEIAAYRIIQEALSNAAKHAEARRIGVSLTASPDHLTVQIEDDGVGFPERKTAANGLAPRGLGLVSMRERAAQVGGSLSVRSGPGAGTVVVAELPLRWRTDADAADQVVRPTDDFDAHL